MSDWRERGNVAGTRERGFFYPRISRINTNVFLWLARERGGNAGTWIFYPRILRINTNVFCGWLGNAGIIKDFNDLNVFNDLKDFQLSTFKI